MATKRKIKYFIVHHSLSLWGDGETIKDWHTKPKPKGNGWKYPGYHVVICNGYPTYNSFFNRKPVVSAIGRVDRILSENIPSNGVKYGNSDSLNVCLIGDFDKNNPLTTQLKKLVDLLVFWCKYYNRTPDEAIRGHGERQREIGKEGYSKSCPGSNVDMAEIRALVKNILKTKAPKPSGTKGERA